MKSLKVDVTASRLLVGRNTEPIGRQTNYKPQYEDYINIFLFYPLLLNCRPVAGTAFLIFIFFLPVGGLNPSCIKKYVYLN